MGWNKIKELVEMRVGRDKDGRDAPKAPGFSCAFNEERGIMPEDANFNRQIRVMFQIHLGQTVWVDREFSVENPANEVIDSHRKRFEQEVSLKFYGEIERLLHDLASHIYQRNWEEASSLIRNILSDA